MPTRRTFSGQSLSYSPKKQQGWAMGLSVFLLLVIAVLLIGGYYLWKQNEESLDLMHEYIADVEKKLGEKHATVQAFQESLAKQAAEAKSKDVILGDHLRELEESLETITNKKRADNFSQTWLLSEVEYLMKMADQRIQLNEDIKGAIALLKKVDELIEQMPADDQGLKGVRVAIKKDIASLEAYKAIDVPGTYAELAALGSSIEKLPMSKREPSTDPSAPPSDPKKKDSFLSDVNEAFAGYLQIRRHDDEEFRMLLSEESMLNIRDSIRLAIEHAQTGLLRHDQSIYDDSLSKIRKYVLQLFPADNFRVQLVNKKLETLSKVRVEYDLPDISSSQQELKRYLSDRMRAMGQF